MTLPSDSIEARENAVRTWLYWVPADHAAAAGADLRALAHRAREAEQERQVQYDAAMAAIQARSAAEAEAKALLEALDLIANGEYYETAEEIARAALAASESSDG